MPSPPRTAPYPAITKMTSFMAWPRGRPPPRSVATALLEEHPPVPGRLFAISVEPGELIATDEEPYPDERHRAEHPNQRKHERQGRSWMKDLARVEEGGTLVQAAPPDDAEVNDRDV